MVFAELAGGITERLQELSNRGILCTHTHRSAGQAHLAQAAAKHALPHDECSAACGAALLAVIVGEYHPLICNPVDVGSPVTHHAFGEDTQVGYADVVAPNDKNVWFLSLRRNRNHGSHD